MMSELATHFAHLDTDRDYDNVGPMIPLEILAPWTHDEMLWGQPYVRRQGNSLYVWGVLLGDAFDKPFARLPVTMRYGAAVEDGGSISLDWRTPYRMRVDDDGFLWVEQYE